MDIRATMQTAPPSAGERASGRRPAHVVAVGALTACVAAGYSVFALGVYHTFQTTSYDLVIFDQAVRSYAHFHPGISIVKGVHNFFGPNFSILGDHWSPILASLAPLYWIHNSPVTLLVAQAALFALAIPPLWVFTRRALGGGRKAVAAAYLVSPPASLKLLVTPEVKLQPMLWLFGAFCFLSLRSPMALAALPLLLERMLANLFGNWWVPSYQYNAYLVVILVFAAVDGAARLDRQLLARQHRAAAGEHATGPSAAGDGSAAEDSGEGPATGPPASRGTRWTGPWSLGLACAVAMCAVAVGLVPHFAFGAAFHSSFYRRDARMNAAPAG